MARIYPLRWNRAQVRTEDNGLGFAWEARSQAMPVHWIVLRTNDHRYQIWCLGPTKDWTPDEVTPLYLGKTNSAPQGKVIAQGAENLLIRMVIAQGYGNRPGRLPLK